MLWVALHVPQLSLQCFAAAWLAGAIESEREPALTGQAHLALPAPVEPAEPTLPAMAVMHQHCIAELNEAAARLGLRRGMKRSTALSLAPHLALGHADAVREHQAMRALAHAAMAYTPMVVLADRSTLWLELQASVRLFGGWPQLQRKLLASVQSALPLLRELRANGMNLHGQSSTGTSSGGMSPRGIGPNRLSSLRLSPRGTDTPPTGADLQLQAAAAPTALGADWLSRWSRAVHENLLQGEHVHQLPAMLALLAQAPVDLPRTPGSAALMQSLGVQRLGQLLSLPRAGLARRVGPELLLECDRALGRCAHPLQPLQWPASFDADLELHHRADSAQALVGAAQLLLSQALAWANACWGQIGRLELHFMHEKSGRPAANNSTALSLELAQASSDPAHWRMVLAERLVRVELPAPCIALRLHCASCTPGGAGDQAAARTAELFPGPQSQQLAMARLLERLSAGLSPGQLAKLQSVADHRPERAQIAAPIEVAQMQSPWGTASETRRKAGPFKVALEPGLQLAGELPLQRPTWLLQPAVALAQRAGRPLWQGQSLQVLSGPQRIETGWWDEQLATRDYFIAQAPDGSLCWLWRARLPQGAPAQPQREQAPSDEANTGPWMLQGLFA